MEPMDPASEDNNASKPVKACDACHAIKVRCVQDDAFSDQLPCARCKRLDMPCLFTPRVRKKHQRRTDARVAHLEREVESLRLALAAQHRHLASSSSPEGADVDRAAPLDSVGGGGGGSGRGRGDDTTARNNSSSSSSSSNKNDAPSPFAQPVQLPDADLDSVRRGIHAAANVSEQLALYRAHFCPLWPVVQVDAAWSARDLAARRPLLLQAIVGCTATVTEPARAGALQAELTKSYVASLISDDAKSLDLVQAILVFVAWYVPPADFKRKRMFYQLAHLAISTAVELGLEVDEDEVDEEEDDGGGGGGGRRRDPERVAGDGDEFDEGTPVERARTYLACYMLSQGVSLTMRRPSMMRGAYGVERTVKFLEKSPRATEMDRFIVSHTKLFLISERVTTTFLNSPDIAKLDIRDPWVQQQLEHHRNELARWHENSGLTSLHGCLAVGYHYLMVYLNEIALYPEHDPRDFRAPFQLEKVGLTKTAEEEGEEGERQQPQQQRRRQQQRPRPADHHDHDPDGAASKCLAHLVKAAHSLLDAFVGFSVAELRMLPVQNYFRLMYAAYVMTKLAMSPLDPRSALGRQLDTRLLRSDHYRAAVVDRLAAASAHGRYPIPTLFLGLLEKLTGHWNALKRKLLLATAVTAGPNGGDGSGVGGGLGSASADVLSDGISRQVAAAAATVAAAAAANVPSRDPGQSKMSDQNCSFSGIGNLDPFGYGQMPPTYHQQDGMAGDAWAAMVDPSMQITDDHISTPMIMDNLSEMNDIGNIVEMWNADDLENWAQMLESQGEGQIHFGW